MDGVTQDAAPGIAQAFHETYERLAPDHGYDTRLDSAVPWEDVPEPNKSLMVAVARDLLQRGVIALPPAVDERGVIDHDLER